MTDSLDIICADLPISLTKIQRRENKRYESLRSCISSRGLGIDHAVGLVESFGARRYTVMRYWSGPGFGRMNGGLAHSASEFLYTKFNSFSSRILSRMNFSCGGAYLRAYEQSDLAPSSSLMTMGFTFAGGSAPSLILKTSPYSVTNCRKLCTPSRDIPAYSALVNKPSIAATRFSGVPWPTSKS
jgi:hypothetical protein